MKFIEFTLKEGLLKRTFKFSEITNLIYSKKNSAGKTTFLRAIIYSLGYPIPNTKGINFKKMEFWLTIENANKQYKIYRCDSYISVDDGEKRIEYSLPIDLCDMIMHITGCNNREIINNLLGAFYVDQEKGWTLLNRGIVIGDIHFNIEELVRGLDGRNCDEELKQLKAVEELLKKYRYMMSVNDYQEALFEEGDDIEYDTPDEKIEIEVEALRSERESIYKEIRQISDIQRKNKILVDYISDFKLIVKSDSGEEIPVTKDTLLDFDDNREFLAGRKRVLAIDLEKIDKKISKLEEKKDNNRYLFKVETSIEAFDSNIKKIKVNPIETNNIIKDLEKQRKNLKSVINKKTITNNSVVKELHDCISKYAKELGVNEEYVSPQRDYIFTRDLKSLSGAILHKIVFSFRLAYIKLIKEKTGIVLPIVLDSPSGREVEHSTVKQMINILRRDYEEHQFIVASIYDYELKNNSNVIEFADGVLTFSDAVVIKE